MSWIPGWDSITSAHGWSNFYFWAGISALLCLGIFEVISHRYTERKDELVAQQQTETQRHHDEEIARLHLETSQANERAAKLALDLEKERQKMAPRPWTKEQFEAIQSLKGKVKAIGIVSQKGCLECELLAQHILSAFHNAGAEIYVDLSHSIDLPMVTGVSVLLPPSANLDNNPIVTALKKAGLNPSSLHILPNWPVRDDMPIITVGERFPQYLDFPFFPKGTEPFTLHPITRK
jgi:hypothetical protein